MVAETSLLVAQLDNQPIVYKKGETNMKDYFHRFMTPETHTFNENLLVRFNHTGSKNKKSCDVMQEQDPKERNLTFN